MEFTRQPRIIPDYPSGEMEVQSAPPMPTKAEISWFSILIMPAASAFITVLMMTSRQSFGAEGGIGGQPIFIIGIVAMAVLSVIGSIVSYNRQMGKYRKEKKLREKKYKQYIKDTDARLQIAAKQQAEALVKLHSSPENCIKLMRNVSPNLWERTPAYNDFLTLRIGKGASKMSLRVTGAKEPDVMNADPLAGEPISLARKYDKIEDVPVSVDLKTAQLCGITGNSDRVTDMITNLLIQAVTHQGYDDVRIVVLAREQSIKKWEWMRFLPHIWNDDLTVRYLLCGADMAGIVLSDLFAMLKEREKKSKDGDGFSGGSYYLFVVEDPTILENSQLRRFVYEPNIKIGVTAIFAAEQVALLPSGCGTIIKIQEKNAEKTDRINGDNATFVPDAPAFTGLDMAARTVAALRLRVQTSGYSLPKSITLSQMLKDSNIAESDDFSTINVEELWQKNKTYNGMSVPIGAGIGSMGSGIFYFDLHETGHGPHGLVAGTTGSGKSELLQSIIASLALNFHPHDITFVLIDYKGGGMADVFKGMAHLAGIITNLSGRQTMRALLSIKGELLRRQTEFARYGVNNIGKYQRLYYRGENPDMKPISHLVLIADEFAELKQDQPEFMKELVSAARVGRSLGIHLILATQKPDGVVDDQIWSNSKFKMCLKVQTESDSNGVLKKPDAAYIKLPGRAYLQVGNDEIYELFQSAYAGADYMPDQHKPKEKKDISVLSLDGKATQIYPTLGIKEQDEEQLNPTQLAEIVKRISSVPVEPLDSPWTPPLKEKIYLDELAVTEKCESSMLSAMVGLVDDPRGQRQFPYELDFFNDGNLLVYGMSGSGKTFLLRTICLALAKRYSPEEVNIYILDMDGTGLKMFNRLPHCGGVLNIDESTVLQQFPRFLFNMMNTRKKLFESIGAENFGEYRANNSLPAVMVLIDNYLGLSETYEDTDEMLQLIIREGFKYGIYFVATAASDYGIRYKMTINFKMVIAFQLVDASGYSSMVGRTDGLEPEDFPGRGLARFETPLEIQVLVPETEKRSTKEIIEAIAENEKREAMPIPVMPEKLDFLQLNRDVESGLVIGLSDMDLSPVAIDFSGVAAFMISGESGCGKSSLATAWLKQCKNTKIYMIDSSSFGLMDIVGLENVVDLREEDLSEFISTFKDILDERKEALKSVRLSKGNISELLHSWEQIIFVFDKFSEFSENYDYEELHELLVHIISKERGLKIMVLALDTISGFAGDYENVTKAIKKEQTGVLLGSMKEQELFDCRVPYGTSEKEMLFGDGYFIRKTQRVGFRAAF